MTEVFDRYSRVADGFGERVSGITEWVAPTPCVEWTVRDLVGHVVSVHRHVVSGFAGSLPAPATDADLARAWGDVTAEVRATLADPDRAVVPVSGRFAPMPLEELIGRLLCIDTVVHTWDLARATGQDEVLDRDAVGSRSRGSGPPTKRSAVTAATARRSSPQPVPTRRRAS